MGIENDIKNMANDIRLLTVSLNTSVNFINERLDKLFDEKKPQDRTKIEKDTKDALKLNDSVEVFTDLEA